MRIFSGAIKRDWGTTTYIKAGDRMYGKFKKRKDKKDKDDLDIEWL